jgi:hypothetical protein
MTKRLIPTHPEGWKFAGSCGDHIVWHAGKNDYRITYGGDVYGTAEQLGIAHAKARQLQAKWDWEMSQPAHQPENFGFSCLD